MDIGASQRFHVFEFIVQLLKKQQHSEKMIDPKFLLFVLTFLLYSHESKSIKTITVMVSQSKPFAFYENQAFKGLDVNIIENFAKKFKLNIKYVLANESLFAVFSTPDKLNNYIYS